MKKTFISILFILSAYWVDAQWQNIAIPGSTAGVTSMFTFGETLMAGTAGDGIFTTEDNGTNWTDISGNLGNKNINDIRGGAGPQIIWVATDNGIFYTEDHASYNNNTGTGLTVTDVNYYWFGDSGTPGKEWAVGTNGGGVFTSENLSGPWSNSGTGLSGDGLYVNDMGGYEDGGVSYAACATEGGIYFSTDQLTSWTQKSNGLTGDALKVRKLTGIGSFVIIATRAGLYWSMDLGDTWSPLVPDEKFNFVGIYPGGTGILGFAFGEKAYFSADLLNWNPVALPSLPAGTEVKSFAMNSTHVFIGTAAVNKESKLSGGVYAAPLDQINTSAEEYSAVISTSIMNQNYPNPFRTSTTITYTLPGNDFVSLKVYDLLGEEVATLVNEPQKAGKHSAVFHPEVAEGGYYFYRLQTGSGIVETKKMASVR